MAEPGPTGDVGLVPAYGDVISPANSRYPLASCGCPVPVHSTPKRQAGPLLLSVALNWEPTHGGRCSFAAAQPAVVKSVTVNGEAATTLVTVNVTPEGICPSHSARTHSAEPLLFSASGLVLPIGNPARDIETPPLVADCAGPGPVPSVDGPPMPPPPSVDKLVADPEDYLKVLS